MPLYDYQCENCSHEEEHLQNVSDERLTQCPSCNEDSYRRKASAPSFTFKGGGWYKDLYGSAKSGATKKSESTSSSSSDSTAKATTPAKTSA